MSNGTGTTKGQHVTNVAVTCATSAFSIGGNVVGLTGPNLVLQNGTEELPVAVSGPFTFPTKVASGATFDVSVKTQPSSGGPCTVSGGQGTVGVTDVNSIVVNCAPGTYTVGGNVSGLDGTVVLQNNGGNNTSISSNGSFAFTQTLTVSQPYAVTVLTQPGYPPVSQTCTVSNGTGTMGSANVTNVAVSCTTNAYPVGGTVSGLSGTIVLKNNGGNDLTLSTNGVFAFSTPILSGNTYAVTVGTQPAGQTCSITNSSGTVTTAAITNVGVSCSAAGGDVGIKCGGASCNPANQVCCVTNGTPACTDKCTGTGTTKLACDTAYDCFVAHQNSSLACCGDIPGGATYCTLQCDPPKVYYCDPNLANPCPKGGTCTPMPSTSGYYRCL